MANDSGVISSNEKSHVCAVCEDETLPGCSFRMHYNVYCCEACKCFFRRSIQLNKIFSCKFYHKCVVSHRLSRHFCKSCRLRKCIQVGMKKDAVKHKSFRKTKFSVEPESPLSDKLIYPYSLSGYNTLEFFQKSTSLADTKEHLNADLVLSGSLISTLSKNRVLAPSDNSFEPSGSNSYYLIENNNFKNSLNFNSNESNSNQVLPMICNSNVIPSDISGIESSFPRTLSPDEILQSTKNSANTPNFCVSSTPTININQSAYSLYVDPELRCSFDQKFKLSTKIIHSNTGLLSSSHYEMASIEEVLDSLKSRILDLFKWSKKSLEFCKLSQNDQKSLLRYTVVELVMLGFARSSIHYDNALYFNHINKIIMPYHPNSAVACVTKLTIEKLVRPLRYLNLNRCEYRIMKEIILYNADSTGIDNEQVVRSMRRARFEQLFLATGNGVCRFGEILSLLTPLFEVATEITDQLRLEQYVQESEATMDAFLLISLLQEVEEVDS